MVDVFVDAIENYERDIMDAVIFYMAEYGSNDTKHYIQMIIQERCDSFVTLHLMPLLNVIGKSREGEWIQIKTGEMGMGYYDLYGYYGVEIYDAQKMLEDVIKITFKEKESLYYGAIYLLSGDKRHKHFLLKKYNGNKWRWLQIKYS